MVDPIYGGHACADKTTADPFATIPSIPSGEAAAVHPGLVASPDLSPDDQVVLLTAIDATGSATLADCAAALPDHPRPVMAVLALAEAGLVELDRQAPFDAHLRVSRRR